MDTVRSGVAFMVFSVKSSPHKLIIRNFFIRFSHRWDTGKEGGLLKENAYRMLQSFSPAAMHEEKYAIFPGWKKEHLPDICFRKDRYVFSPSPLPTMQLMTRDTQGIEKPYQLTLKDQGVASVFIEYSNLLNIGKGSSDNDSFVFKNLGTWSPQEPIFASLSEMRAHGVMVRSKVAL